MKNLATDRCLQPLAEPVVVRKNSVRAPHRRLGGLFDQVILVM